MSDLTIANWLASSSDDDDPMIPEEGGAVWNPAEQKDVRAVFAEKRISHKATVDLVFFTPDNEALDPQTVRIESANNANTIASDAGKTPQRLVTVLGIRDHPFLPDTIVDQGYWFEYDDDVYYVMDIILTHGEVQALSRTPG
jgi:hypothetical protein